MRNSSIVELRPKEEIVAVVRRHPLTALVRATVAFLWLLTPFFFFFPLIQAGMAGIFVFLFLLATGIWHALRERVRYTFTMLLVTDQRVVDIEQHGLIARDISEIDLAEIRNVAVRKEGVGKLFGIGTVRIETVKAHAFDVEFSGVKRPERVRDLLVDVQYMGGQHTPYA